MKFARLSPVAFIDKDEQVSFRAKVGRQLLFHLRDEFRNVAFFLGTLFGAKLVH